MPVSTKTFKAGEHLFKEGQISDCMYLVKKGMVGIRKMRGREFVEIARIYPNQVLGELSFFDRQARSAAAIALNDVEVLEIDFTSLDKTWNSVPDYMRSIMMSVAQRLRKANETIRKLQKTVDPSEIQASEAEMDGEDLVKVAIPGTGESGDKT